MSTNKSIIERVSDLVAEAISRMKTWVEKRVDPLEKKVESLQTEFKSTLQAAEEAASLPAQLTLHMEQLKAKLEETYDHLSKAATELQLRTSDAFVHRIEAYHEAMAAREALQNEVMGQLKMLVSEKNSAPSIPEVIRQCVESFREADSLLIKRFEETLATLVEGAKKEFLELGEKGHADVLKAVPTPESVARLAANLVQQEAPAVDLSKYATTEQVALHVSASLEKLPSPIKMEEVLSQIRESLPSAIKSVVQELPVPEVDLSSFATKSELQNLEASLRQLKPAPEMKDILAEFSNYIPTSGALAREAAGLIEVPELPPLEEIASRAAALIPSPKDGKSVSPEEVRQLVEEAVSKFKLPDAKAVAEELASTVATWALDFERRAQDILQRSVDRMPKPEDGKDGLGFEDLVIEHDGARTFSFKMVRGSQEKNFSFKVPVMLYRGIFDETLSYDRGDVATWGGSSWIALKDLPQGKPGNTRDWQLIVKKGRDGSSK